MEQEIESFIVRMARENPSWVYDRIVGALANLGHKVSHQTVANIFKRHDIPPAAKRKHSTSWKDFIRAHMAVMVGTDFFTAVDQGGENKISGPAAPESESERVGRTLGQVGKRRVPIEADSLRRAFTQTSFCITTRVIIHRERNHQGKGNLLLFPSPGEPLSRKQGTVRCRQRLGGLLKYYERDAA